MEPEMNEGRFRFFFSFWLAGGLFLLVVFIISKSFYEFFLHGTRMMFALGFK